jgi:galactokinase
MSEAEHLFKKQFGHKATHVVQAPGRAELLGNHTDYNQGLVLAVAVDKCLTIASSPRADGKIALASSAFPQIETFSLSNIAKNPAAPWADYVKGVLRQLQQHHVPFRGFNAALHSTIPMGAGLSSSAALAVATALTVRELCPYTLTATSCTAPPRRDQQGQLPTLTAQDQTQIARLCLAAESEFVEVNCGLLDQLTCLFGKSFHAVEIDCQSVTVETVPMLGEVDLVLCHTGVKRELVAGQYNALRRHCEAAARSLGVKALRTVDPELLEANKSRLSAREYECAHHVVGEIRRVIFGTRALREGDLEQFGQYMFQSHESSRKVFRNSCAELDLLVELARAHRACLGARLTGGGFGGATISLVHRKLRGEFMRDIAAGYQTRSGHVTDPMLCRIVDGAGAVKRR